MKGDAFDVDLALRVLESDAPLVAEPRAIQFVAWERGGSAFPQIRRIIPQRIYFRASRAIGRIRTRAHRELRALMPVDCRICAQPFMRNTMNQRRCPACVKAGKQYPTSNPRRIA